jgi:hypothetical protein
MYRSLVLLVTLVLLPTVAHADEPARTFAGSIQLDYLAIPTSSHSRDTTLDGATVELSVKLTRDFNKNFSASVKACFACHGFEAGMAFVEMRAADELRLRVGRLTPAFGSFPQRHDPANHMTSDKPLPYDMGRMIERTEWNEGILPSPWVDNGLEVTGTHFWHGGQLDYSVFAMSGPKGDPTGIDFDFVQSHTPSVYYVDNNSEPMLGGRVSLTLDLSDTSTLAAGVSGMMGHYDPARDLSFEIGGADLVLSFPAVILRAEYLVRRTEYSLGPDPAMKLKFVENGGYATHFLKQGFYAEAEVPIGKLSAIARWDGLIRHGNVLAGSALDFDTYLLRYTAAVAYRLASGIRIKASVEYYDFKELDDELGLHLGVATAF